MNRLCEQAAKCDFSPINSKQVPIVFICSVHMGRYYVIETQCLRLRNALWQWNCHSRMGTTKLFNLSFGILGLRGRQPALPQSENARERSVTTVFQRS